MSIIQDKVVDGRYVKGSAKVIKEDKKSLPSLYLPGKEAKEQIKKVIKHFQQGWQTMHLPRIEFNDLSLYQRHVIDMLSFNTYQENDGQAPMEDRIGGWRSRVVKPVVRNKAISIAAHETSKLTVPKTHAYNQQNDEQRDVAEVMQYLIDYAKEQSNYAFMALYRIIQSLYSPISWGYTTYQEVYRNVKDEKINGKWTYKRVLVEEDSGFKHIPIPTDQIFFPNFYERDVQKQDWIIMRRILSYDTAKARYGDEDNFQFVHPGIQVIFVDANNGYYNVYDPHMQEDEVEEIIYWNKSDDVRLILVNGVMMTEYDAPNPRNDKQYPFDAFYYLPINERCIAGKSLVSAMQPDANIIITLYRMILDGSFLNLFPPTVTTGSDKTGSDVIVPGLNLAFAEKDVQVNALRTADGQSLNSAMNTLAKAEESLAESSQNPIQQGQGSSTPSTAYEISRLEQNAATVLGLSMKFISQHAVNYGKLLISDILQYLTIADATKITGDKGLIYKTFYAKEPNKAGMMNKVQFLDGLPEEVDEKTKEEMSFDILMEQGGLKAETKIFKVNPVSFRNHKFMFSIDADTENPRSADLERALDIETYDRAISSPIANQEEIFKDLLMASNPKTSRDPDKYVMKPDFNAKAQEQLQQQNAMTEPIQNTKLPQSFAQ